MAWWHHMETISENFRNGVIIWLTSLSDMHHLSYIYLHINIQPDVYYQPLNEYPMRLNSSSEIGNFVIRFPVVACLGSDSGL